RNFIWLFRKKNNFLKVFFLYSFCPVARDLSPVSPPSRSPRFPPPLVSASCSYTCTEDTPRLHQIPLRLTTATASLYEILEVPLGATSQDIKSAYRRLARICHPDVAGTDRTTSADEFMKIHAAYCTLSDPEKRSVYDRRMLRRNRPLTVGNSGMGSYVGRNWETDQCW
ncbi:chaperone protein dnaJ 11, chloroplastic-like, partial [Brassica napus]|uniref:chaperone protein dnaJ 11, chloroplastic-like n=1 Tax=Brassica napus TaxID=3708 RepID=UPI0020794EAA